MYKLVVFDLDDTLAAVGEVALSETLALIKNIEKTGVNIAVCSGKPVYYLCGFMRQAGIKNIIMVGENGAVVQFGTSLPPKRFAFFPYLAEADNEISFLKKEIDKLIPDIWYQPNQVALTPFPRSEEEFDIIMGCIDSCREKISHLTVYRHCDSIDITPSEITKYTGLKHLSDITGIKPEEMIAVGDGVNDYPMFEFAKYRVGVNVKHPEAVDKNFKTIKEALKHVCEVIK